MRLTGLLKMARENVLEGVFAINKPMGMSSAQVIRDCQTHFNPSALFQPLLEQEAAQRAREPNSQQRRRSRAKRDLRVKVGHGGTLDPLATGVLILGVGRGTKELPRFLQCTKTYETVVLFGASTDTYDRVGRVLKRRAYGDVTRARVEEALAAFRGRYRQMPPLYSALKMNGKPLYEYAREGLSIPREIETREVEVSALELVEWYDPGTHNHRWPVDEAGAAEQTLAERVWRIEKDQAAGKKKKPLSPEEEKSDREALAAHEDFKRKAEEKQDELVFDRPSKRRRGVDAAARNTTNNTPARANTPSNGAATNGNARPPRPAARNDDQLMMSGALGELPRSPYHDNPAAVAATQEEVDEAAAHQAPQKDEPPAAAPAPVPTPASASTSTSAPKPKVKGGRGSNLIPPPPSPDTPPPWEGKGPPACKIRLTVSSGFYVRSFCHDLGEKVGSAAMMAELARTRQSDFRVGTGNCLEYNDLDKGEAVWAPQVERLLQLWKSGSVAEAGEETAPAETVPAETRLAETVKAEKDTPGGQDTPEDTPATHPIEASAA